MSQLLFSFVDLLDDASVTVRGNVFHDVFEGTIYTPDEEYHIEPADRYASNMLVSTRL